MGRLPGTRLTSTVCLTDLITASSVHINATAPSSTDDLRKLIDVAVYTVYANPVENSSKAPLRLDDAHNRYSAIKVGSSIYTHSII